LSQGSDLLSTEIAYLRNKAPTNHIGDKLQEESLCRVSIFQAFTTTNHSAVFHDEITQIDKNIDKQ
jgi:hypothetical protein